MQPLPRTQDPEVSFDEFPEPVDKYNRYLVGITTYPQPHEREFKHMLRLVAYDICEAGRLRRVAKICELYGVRIEKSVFECDLAEDVFQDFWLELMDEIVEDEDAIIAYRICRS